MRIGIISDTHSQFDRTREAVSLLQGEGIEALIHCGDIVNPGIISLCAPVPSWFVFGNNDDYPIENLNAIRQAIGEVNGVCLEWGGEVELAGKRLAVTHGHSHGEFRRLMKANPDYLFTGHTHEMLDDRRGSTRHINPGALHRAPVYSVAVLDLASDDLRFLTIPRR